MAEIKLLYGGGFQKCGNNDEPKYVHGNNGSSDIAEIKRLFTTENGGQTIVNVDAKNPTDADVFIAEGNELHVFESKCSPKMKCTYRTTMTGQSIHLFSEEENSNEHVWSKEFVDDGMVVLTVLVDYNRGEKVSKRYSFRRNKKEATILYDFVENSNGYPSSTNASMFKDCGALVTCELPCEMKNIANNTFRGCTSLTSYTKSPEFITSIGDYTFADCKKMTKLLIPRFASIGIGCFSGCTGADTIDWDALNNEEKCNMTSIPDEAFKNCINLKKTIFSPSSQTDGIIAIPKNITTIGMSAFEINGIEAQQSMSELFMHDVTNIGSSAFHGQTNLASISGMSKVTTIGAIDDDFGAFEDCTSLVSIDSFNRLNTLGKYAFKGCDSLENVPQFTSSLTNLHEGAFSGCTSLISVDLANASISEISKDAFNGCTSLTTISSRGTNDLPNITTVGISAFNGCTSLTTYPTPNANVIEEGAFGDCTSLSNITMSQVGNNSLSIGANAFSGCTNLKTITFEGYTNISGSNSSFSSVVLDEITFDIGENDTLVLRGETFIFSTHENTIVKIYGNLCTTLKEAFDPQRPMKVRVPELLIQDYIRTYGDYYGTYWTWQTF